jgi:hypothetical protein
VGSGSSPLSCGVFLPLPLLQAFLLLVARLCRRSCLLWPAYLFSAHVGSGLPPSPVEFSSHHHFYKLSRSWLLGVCHHSCLLQPACEGFPLPLSVLRVPRPLCYVSLFFLLLLIIQFLFFPWVGSVCPGGYADLAQDCLWEYYVLLISPCGLHLPKLSGCWHLAAAQEPSWFLHLT